MTIAVEVRFREPLFVLDMAPARYYEHLSADAREWLEEHVGPFDPKPGYRSYGKNFPDPQPGQWDIVRLGTIDKLFIRFYTEEHAVMFKLRWPESVVG